MGVRTSYSPGTFSWAELATSDAAAAKTFYSALFAWAYDDMPVGDEQVYTMAKRDGQVVGALYSDADEPPHWNCYVTVESADAATARAGELGGTVKSEPFDVMDAGRMGVVADPGGATLYLWEPRSNIGASLVNAPGALAWNDLVTPDAETAARFYGDLFGWTAEEIPGAHGYRAIRNGERSNGGIMPSRDGTAAWMPYFGHEDLDRAIAEIGGLGGKLLNGPTPVPSGAFAVVSDPQGAVFGVLTAEYED
jgi:predicted enzyme related to lactoylglutathione lyase